MLKETRSKSEAGSGWQDHEEEGGMAEMISRVVEMEEEIKRLTEENKSKFCLHILSTKSITLEQVLQKHKSKWKPKYFTQHLKKGNICL